MSLVVERGYEAYEEIIQKAYAKLDPIDQISRHGSPIRKVVMSAAEVAEYPSMPDDIVKVGVTFEAELGQRNPDAAPHWKMREVVLRRISDRNYIVVPEKGQSRKAARESLETVGKVRKARKKPAPKKVPAKAPADDEFND